ncbi:MAG: NAD(P)-dependent alcohol dehydrogenase [Gammaproteobacteria bacterium]
MKAYQVKTDEGFQAIECVELPDLKPADDEILVKMKACSLNYRDLLIPLGGYPRNETRPVVPLSDGAGEIVETGKSVKGFKPGQRVMGNFFQDWVKGPVDETGLWSALGGGIDGTLAEYFLLKAHGTLAIPDYLSYSEAATLPCAAVTAWHALVELGNINKDQTILLLGTGGVSIFALQIAKAKGAKVIITSSSDEKLARARKMGADHTVNYVTHPDWEVQVMKITDNQGVDNVLEVGGPGTFEKSIASTKVYGVISLIGILSGLEGAAFNLGVALNLLKIHGIYVGSVEMFQAMVDFMSKNDIHPVVDIEYEFQDALKAYQHLSDAKHFGKVVIKGT